MRARHEQTGFDKKHLRWIIPIVGFAGGVTAQFLPAHVALLLAAGVAGLALVLLRGWQSRSPGKQRVRRELELERTPAPPPATAQSEDAPVMESPSDIGALIETMLSQGRYALLLRPQIISNLEPGQLQLARCALARGMSVVPEGKVLLVRNESLLAGESREEEERARQPGRVVYVQPFYLDRHPVTNAQYYEFLLAGGYEQMSFWEAEVWPAVLDFVDRTGYPGPRFWTKGRYPAGEENHPVVGISWYEAAAFARWVGKRLPTDAEWVKSGSWPVALPSGGILQRKYPWGDSMDRSRANLWGSGPGRTVPVDQYPEGSSVGGIDQLIGNVWEWTASSFSGGEAFDCTDSAMSQGTIKSLRGGAFDTYFDIQATCQFQSGDHALARKHNIGFRCALGACDLASWEPVESSTEPAESEAVEVGA